MPGLFGIISRKQPETCEQQVRTMLASMRYEPFYNSGIHKDQEMSLYAGWTCHPQSFCDCLPVTNRAKDVVLFLTGEIFENQDQFTGGKGEGSLSDARGIVGLYEKWGEKFFERLNGWFSGLLLDTRRGRAFLFNDRYGMDRVFVHEGVDGFYFSSEAKALLAVLPQEREFDIEGLSEFLTCGCTLGSRSLYKGVSILPPGALWTFAGGEIERRGSYFQLDGWTGQECINEEQLESQVVDLLGGLAAKYARGPLPVGISLTGGLDSRMVMACLDTKANTFPCYTFGSMYRDTFDVQVARKVAKTCGQDYHVLVLGDEFLRDLPRHLERAVYISDGYIGLSGAAELYLNSRARDIAPVRLTGNYGGELLRGDRAFKSELPHGAFVNPDMEPHLLEANKAFKELEVPRAVTFALFHQAPSQGYGRRAIERSQVTIRTPFMDNDLVSLIYRASPPLLQGERLSRAVVSKHNVDLLEIPTDRGELGDGSRFGSMIRRSYRSTFIKAEYFVGHGMSNRLTALRGFGLGKTRFMRSFFNRATESKMMGDNHSW